MMYHLHIRLKILEAEMCWMVNYSLVGHNRKCVSLSIVFVSP